MSAKQNVGNESSRHAQEYTSFASEIDLTTDSDGPNNGKACREIVVTDVTAGANLGVEFIGGHSEVFDMTNLVGVPRPWQIHKILTSTTVSKLQVTW